MIQVRFAQGLVLIRLMRWSRTESYGTNMLKVISARGAALVLSGCIVTPGMQNLDTTKIKMQMVSEPVEIHPTLIPINTSLIAGQRASTYFYRVASDDVLKISVRNHPEFNSGHSSYRVNSTGRIYFPQIGYVQKASRYFTKNEY